MKNVVAITLGFFVLVGGLFFAPATRDFFSGIAPLVRSAPETPEGDELPFSLPDGFSAYIFTDEVPGARVLVRDMLGNFWVSQTREGTISLIELDKETGSVARVSTVFEDLQNPHGLAFDPRDPFTLYIAEEHRVSKATVYSEGAPQKVMDLPSDGGHSTRTLMVHSDGKQLLVSAGSSCNVCEEADPHRAAILSYNLESGEISTFATGLRNTVFMTTHYVTGEVWGTDMGRDLLGDNLPPDEINIIRAGEDYGWPYCYGENLRDQTFRPDEEHSCTQESVASHIDITPAHSAPLGIVFVPEEGWPEEYWYDALVAYHGSWNRSIPTGYKIVRFPLDAEGNQTGSPTDFMAGFMTESGEVIGRPVDILIEPGGSLYISDDRAGAIYRVIRTSES